MRSLPLLTLLLLLAPPGPAGAQPLSVTLVPTQVVLGRDPVVLVRVETPPGTPPLRAAASTGRLSRQRASPPGVTTYAWTPPDIRYPLRAVLAFWTDPPEGPPDITQVSIPLLGRTELAVDTAPGAQVVVELAGQSFGPTRADRRGRAKVLVLVPPGGGSAKVRVTSVSQRPSLRSIDVEVPPERPLLAVFSPEQLPVDGSGWLVFLGDQPVSGAQLRPRVLGARHEEVRPGVFLMTPEAGAREVVVEAQRPDGTGTTRVSAPVVVASPPAPEPPPPALALVVPVAETTPPLRLGPVVAPPPSPPRPPAPPTVSLQVLGGGFFAGGDNRGPLGSFAVGVRLPGLAGRLVLEAEAGMGQSTLQLPVEGLGEVDARMRAFPLLFSLRGLAFEHGRFSLQGRLGAGPAYYSHRAMGSFLDTPLVRQGQTYMTFLAAQAAWRLGPVSTLLEVRGGYSPVRVPLVQAQLGGLSACVGLRYGL